MAPRLRFHSLRYSLSTFQHFGISNLIQIVPSGYIIDTDSGELSEVKPLEGPGEREGQPQPAGQAQADKPGLMSSIKQEVERILPALGAGMAQPPAGSADAQL